MQVAIRQKSEAGATAPASRVPSAPASLALQAKEDAAIWTRAWVGLGFAADIAQPADILPVTVGNHGIHVERQADGTILGRFNKAQHGGCRAVPLQCQTGTKTRCSFTACGYSRDRRPILVGDTDRLLHLDQYLGLRPERLLTVATRMWGPVIAARLDPLATSDLDWPQPAPSFEPAARPCGETRWLEPAANWRHVMVALAASEPGCRADARFPNVVMLSMGGISCCIVLHPTALRQTLCRIRFFAHADAQVDEVLQELRLRFEQAEAWQADEARIGEVADAEPVRAWLDQKIAEAFEALDAEDHHGALYRTNDKGV